MNNFSYNTNNISIPPVPMSSRLSNDNFTNKNQYQHNSAPKKMDRYSFLVNSLSNNSLNPFDRSKILIELLEINNTYIEDICRKKYQSDNSFHFEDKSNKRESEYLISDETYEKIAKLYHKTNKKN